MNLTTLRAACAIALVPPLLAAQATERDPARIATLADLMVGEWTVDPEANSPSGWQAGTRTTITIAPVLGGVAIEGRGTVAAPGSNFDLRTTWSWEPTTGVYRVAVLDADFGILDIYEGGLRNDTLRVDNLATATRFRTPSGAEMAFRLTWVFVAPGEFTFHVDYTADEGATWSAWMRARHLRVTG